MNAKCRMQNAKLRPTFITEKLYPLGLVLWWNIGQGSALTRTVGTSAPTRFVVKLTRVDEGYGFAIAPLSLRDISSIRGITSTATEFAADCRSPWASTATEFLSGLCLNRYE